MNELIAYVSFGADIEEAISCAEEMKALSERKEQRLVSLNESNERNLLKVFPKQFIVLGVCAVSFPAQQAMIF